MKHAWNVFSVLIVMVLAVGFISMGANTYAQGTLPTPDLGIEPTPNVRFEPTGYPIDPGYPIDYGYPIDPGYPAPVDPGYLAPVDYGYPVVIEVLQISEPVVIEPVLTRLMSNTYHFIR